MVKHLQLIYASVWLLGTVGWEREVRMLTLIPIAEWEEKVNTLKKYLNLEAENFLHYKNLSLQMQIMMCIFKIEEHKSPYKDTA